MAHDFIEVNVTHGRKMIINKKNIASVSSVGDKKAHISLLEPTDGEVLYITTTDDYEKIAALIDVDRP